MEQNCKFCRDLASDNFTFQPHLTPEGKLIEHSDLHSQQLKFSIGTVKVNVFDLCFCQPEPVVEYQSLRDVINEVVNGNGDTSKQKKAPAKIVNPITVYCRKLFAKRRRTESRIECSECGEWLNLTTKTSGINSTYITYHVTMHLGKLLFACSLCDYKSLRKNTIISHLNNEHQSIGEGNYVDLTNRFEKEICAMIDRCFGQREKGAQESDMKRIYSIRRYCRQLLIDQGRDRFVCCNECKAVISVREINGHLKRSHSAVNHALLHLSKFFYACRHCSCKRTNDSAMKVHLAKRHSLGPNKANYVDMTGEFRDEIIAMVKRCFEKRDPAVTVSSAPRRTENAQAKAILAENVIKSRFGENRLQAERHVHSRRLLQKFAQEGKIKCRICSHLVNVKQFDGNQNQKAIWHATTHVDKPLFRCKRCNKGILVMSSVYRHMKKEHKITKGIANEYDDLSNEYHREILDALTRSFDWDKDKVTTG